MDMSKYVLTYMRIIHTFYRKSNATIPNEYEIDYLTEVKQIVQLNFFPSSIKLKKIFLR